MSRVERLYHRTVTGLLLLILLLPLAATLGYLAFDEVPAWNTLTGMGLIIVSGIYIGYREVVNARNSIMPTAEASFAPGNPGVMPEGYELDSESAESDRIG